MPGENSNQPASAAPAQAPAAVTPPPAAAAAPVQPAAAIAPILGEAPAAPATAAPAASIPEKYEVKAPEGQTLDALSLDTFTPVFKELGLSNEQVQKLVDVQFKVTSEAVKASEKTIADQVAAETAQWAKQSREDKDFGGANFEANAKIANKALAAFGTPELRSLLTESGYANHPAMVRLFWTIGQKLSESTPPALGSPTQKQSPERVLYPSMNS